LLLPKRISVLHRLLDEEGHAARTAIALESSIGPAKLDAGDGAPMLMVEPIPEVVESTPEGVLVQATSSSIAPAKLDAGDGAPMVMVEPIPEVVEKAVGVPGAEDDDLDDDAPIIVEGLSDDTGVNAYATMEEVYDAISTFQNFEGAHHAVGQSSKLTCLIYPRPRRMATEDWLEKCAKELQEFFRTHEDNPFGRGFVRSSSLEEEESYAWHTSYAKILPQRLPKRGVVDTGSPQRWGHIASEPARRAFWYSLLSAADHTRRLALLFNLMMENWTTISGDGSCFFRSLLRGFSLPFDNAALLAFKLRIRSVLETISDATPPEVVASASSSVVQNNTVALEHFNLGWFGTSTIRTRGEVQVTSDPPTAYSHRYQAAGWGDLIDFGKMLVANSVFVLRRTQRNATYIMSIRHVTADKCLTEPFALNSPVMLYGNNDSQLGYTQVSLFIALSYLLRMHDDVSDPFDITRDLCILVYAGAHYSTIIQFGDKFK
jgi:hypothetical protein